MFDKILFCFDKHFLSFLKLFSFKLEVEFNKLQISFYRVDFQTFSYMKLVRLLQLERSIINPIKFYFYSSYFIISFSEIKQDAF